ncbi:FAD-dependent monooxygenase [Amycolatopsis sp. NPDC047767]|uniref:FAD-dependent monooxygenase n=1 Tax=Amycolatopsis sp. NPDC047767 TaxID=3156765 RepID=UPI0034511AC5
MLTKSSSRRGGLLVLGGGIGGLAAALALARDGHAVRVLEQAPEFAEIGAGLQVGPNASRVLDRLGVLEAVTRDAFFPRSLVLRDAMTGERITSLDTEASFESRFRHRYFVTHRADLHRALLDACLATGKVELLADKHVVTVRPDATVDCADGSRYEAEALIGADGLHSPTRALLIGDGEPEDCGYVAHRGTVPVEEVTGGLTEPDSMVIWVGPGLHLVQYPVRSGKLCNQVATFDTRRYPAQHGDLSRQLDDAFRGTCPEVARGIALIDRSRRWAMLDRPPATGWSQGRVTLVGDAAHPMLQYLAQGACQAIEDSVALADSLAAHDDVETAFLAYERIRAPRTARVQTTARTWGDLLHLDGVGALLRAHALKPRAADDFEIVDWLYGFDPTSTQPALAAARRRTS